LSDQLNLAHVARKKMKKKKLKQTIASAHLIQYSFIQFHPNVMVRSYFKLPVRIIGIRISAPPRTSAVPA